ncbi:MAG: hypothetical protein M3R27_14120 [Bacteroidota bacterium]|nr:hypothetical protein [Bacteroidota bacterium]
MRIIFLALVFVTCLSSCKKDYICVCTDSTTGEKTYGDEFRAGPLMKETVEKSCKANEDAYNNLEDCHLE